MTLMATACTSAEDEPETATATLEAPVSAAPASETPSEESPSEAESPSASPSPSPSPAALPAEFLQDSDGNAIPDEVERATGRDPLVDDCALASCPGVAGLDPAATASVEQNVLLVLDSSGSMAADDGSGTIKIDAARAALERYAFGVPPNYRLGLEVFGHRGSNEESGKAESCAGIDIVSPLGSLNRDNAAAALNQFQPTGYTPIAAALTRAAEAFAGTEGAGNRVILVTDGIETCEGDPVAAAAALKQAGIAVTVDVVGFDVEGDADREALQRIAEATGGTYTNARDAAELDRYFDDLLAQGAQLMDGYVCVNAAVNDVLRCNSEMRAAAQVYLFDRYREEQNLEVGQLYVDIYNDEILPWEATQRARLQEFARVTQEDLARRFEETRRLYEQRYGRPIAFGPFCMDRFLL